LSILSFVWEQQQERGANEVRLFTGIGILVEEGAPSSQKQRWMYF
jgi:hypothetical protein